MKNILTTLLCCIAITTVLEGQVVTPQFEMPLYFEDAVGNKDTLMIGYNGDKVAFGFDPLYDGPIESSPLDSVFEIRAFHSGSNATINDFLLKKIIVSYDNFPGDSCGVSEGIYMVISAKYPPVTMRYDSTRVGSITCRNNAILSLDEQIFFYQYWWDAPNYYCMGGQSAVKFEIKDPLYDQLKVWQIDVEGQGKRDLPGAIIVFHEWGACTNPTLLNADEENLSGMPALNVYPVPSSGFLQIAANAVERYSNAGLHIINILGNTVATRAVDFEQGDNNLEWDVQFLPDGMYWLECLTLHGRVSVPVVIHQ